MRSLKSFLGTIDIQMVMVTIVCLIGTHLSIKFEFVADLPTALISVAIIFPVVFAINAAYRRREQALSYFSDIKGNSMALYYAYRDWIPEKNEELTKEAREKLKWEPRKQLEDGLKETINYFKSL